jgi:hypothetical protein
MNYLSRGIMSKPTNLSELHFRVISLTKGLDPERLSLVMVVGKDTEGNPQVWADEHSIYRTEHENLTIREALRSMTSRDIPFLEAAEPIRSEWLNLDGSWFLDDEKEIAV